MTTFSGTAQSRRMPGELVIAVRKEGYGRECSVIAVQGVGPSVEGLPCKCGLVGAQEHPSGADSEGLQAHEGAQREGGATDGDSSDVLHR